MNFETINNQKLNGDWGLGPIPQTQTPKPQPPIPNPHKFY